MKSKLFMTLKSPHEFNGLELVREAAKGSKSGMVLFEDAVIFAANAKMGRELLSVVQDVYIMRDDWEARGLPLAMPEFKVIDYPEAVELIMETYEQTIMV
jgi:sulfur relay protein TusB/DsrH